MITWKNIVLIICMQYGFDVRSSMHEGTQEIDMERDTPTTAIMSHPPACLRTVRRHTDGRTVARIHRF